MAVATTVAAAIQGRSKASNAVAAMPTHRVCEKHIPSVAAVTNAAVMLPANQYSAFLRCGGLAFGWLAGVSSFSLLAMSLKASISPIR